MIRVPKSRPAWGIAVYGVLMAAILYGLEAVDASITVSALTFAVLCGALSIYMRLPVKKRPRPSESS